MVKTNKYERTGGKIQMKKLFIILMTLAMLTTSAFADFKVTFHNTSEHKKIFRVNWDNHPYGCRLHFGRMFCYWHKTVGEIPVGETRESNFSGLYGEVGNIYTIKWDKLPTDNHDEEATEYTFTVTEGLREIKTTPYGIEEEGRE